MGADPGDEGPVYFVLARGVQDNGVAAHSPGVGMGVVVVAERDDISGGLADVVTGRRRAGIC